MTNKIVVSSTSPYLSFVPTSFKSGAIEAFISVWATTVVDETITIPCQNVGTFNAVVDWGDTSPPETITTYNGFTHEYAAIGEHTISITGTFPNIYFAGGGDKLKLKRVTNLGTVGWTRFNNAFNGCVNLTEFTAGSTDTSAVTDINTMFGNCAGLTSVDVSSLDTSLVTSMLGVFANCYTLPSLDLSSFVTTNVTDMYVMFYQCNALTSIVGVEDFDITGLNSTGDLNLFLTSCKMTTPQYDNLLVKWEAQASVIPAMTASFGTSILTLGGAADTAKQSLINTYGWTVSDGVTP